MGSPRRRPYLPTEQRLKLAEERERLRQIEKEHRAYLKEKRNRKKRQMLKLMNAPRTCIGDSRVGTPCSAPALPGLMFCGDHGGSTYQAKRAAWMRMQLMLEPAMKVLHWAMSSDNEEIAVKAALAILDRNGMGPKSTLVHERGETFDRENETVEERIERTRQVLRVLESRRKALPASNPLPEPDVLEEAFGETIDGEVIDPSESVH